MKTSRLEADYADLLVHLEGCGAIADVRYQVRHVLYAAPGWSGCSCQFTDPPPGACKVRTVCADFEFKTVTGDTVTVDAKGYLDRNSAQAVGYRLFRAVHGRRVLLWGK